MTPRVAIVLCGPVDLVGAAIDTATGRRGWSHVTVAYGLRCIDVDRHRGVCERPLCEVVTPERRVRSLELDAVTGAHVLERLRTLIGRPYDHAAMLRQPFGAWGIYCSAVVYWSLPRTTRYRFHVAPPAPADFEVLWD